MSPSHLLLPESQPADPSRSVDALCPKSDAVPSRPFSDVMERTTAAKSRERSRPKDSDNDYEFDAKRDAANFDVQTAATNREEAVNNFVPLSAPIAPVIPLPLSPAGQSLSRGASGDAGSSDLESANDEDNGLDLRTLGLQSVSQREMLVLNLRAAISRLEEAETEEMDAIASDSKIILFPGQTIRDSKIIPVQFSAGAMTAALDPASTGSESQLPPDGPNTEKSAGLNPQIARLQPVTGETSDTPKSNAKAHFYGDSNAVGPNVPGRGTSTARRERNMDSRSASAHFDPLGDDESLSDVSKDSTELSASGLHVPPRLVSGAEWPSPAPWNAVNNVSSEITTPASVDAAAAVERISKMVNREATLFRQHTSDSMSVVLRPDANTELFLHLNRRDGQIEASVRCERGDFHQLNALWSQLQESLAQLKVRLNPLQESAGDTGSGLGSALRDANGFAFSNRDESSRHARSNDDFMDEWPAPASRDQEPAHVRSRRESGHRLSTSRPGWETWA
ncbi:MAG TPA: hypothetical protein VJS65_09125 [Verrucomicrobiae bacterium]|nr:hypothetical protein [Verrucomicrobiae bacterium]